MTKKSYDGVLIQGDQINRKPDDQIPLLKQTPQENWAKQNIQMV